MSPDGGNNWYTYTIYGLDNPRVIFNNNTTDAATRQQHPGINQPGIEITEDEIKLKANPEPQKSEPAPVEAKEQETEER